ncbi:Spy/CpxP family protein refolding chaperone [Pseudomonas sp. sp1636]|uniref:Spy/CpxP family protein refolding chaperone n=1 Tax=Pseudomonas sp. sp1636 TaxID=3036707 RepID=UPI0025A4F71F|nr:Spy/CpxP family protein refolding chaperone [Pseudomonas sp. sp1636]MDM8350170.1 Spy/CpxP family protein refolding chaperone [Pseudomonas sp. sp1636]
MRKTLTALLLALTLPTLAMAMPEGGPHHDGYGGHGDRHGSRMFNDLDLSQEQRRELRKLMGEQMKSRHEITQRYLEKLPAAEQKALQDELKAAQDKQHSSIRDLLRPEQQKTFDEHQKKMQERRAERAAFKAWKAEQAGKAKAE